MWNLQNILKLSLVISSLSCHGTGQVLASFDVDNAVYWCLPTLGVSFINWEWSMDSVILWVWVPIHAYNKWQFSQTVMEIMAWIINYMP